MPSERDRLPGDEQMLAEMRPHPAIVAPPLLALGVAVALAVVITLHFPSAPVAVAWVLVAMVGLPALWSVGRVVRWRTTRLVVSNRRILYRRGVLRRDVVQLRLQRVAEVECRQTLVDRLIGRGRLVFEVAAGDGPLVVDDVRRPRWLQRLVSAELDALDHVGAAARFGAHSASGRAGPDAWPPSSDTPPHGNARTNRATAGSVSGTRSGSVRDTLLQLDELRRRGVISESEFSAKKAELLDRL